MPAFFLSTTGEYEPLAAPRACWEKARLRDVARDDHMLVIIEPALIGQPFGLGATDITESIISSQRLGQTLYPISELPMPVYVSRVLDKSVMELRVFTREQVEVIAWGMLFRTRAEGLEYAEGF